MVHVMVAEGRGWNFQGNDVMHMELWGNHVWFRPTGELYVKFDDGDEYCWSTVRGATVGSRNPVPRCPV